jgi:hypothetical protein
MKWFDAWLGSRTLTKLAVAKLRVELSLQAGRFEAIEERVAALADRFNRFQNREGMRHARQALETDQSLADEAEAIVARSEAPPEPVTRGMTAGKLELWKKRKLS